MNYIIDHIPKSKSKRPGTKMSPLYITIHNTGNPKSTARNERNYLTNPNNTGSASFHIVVDEKEIIEAIPLDEVAYHSGNSGGNKMSIGIEICESGNQAKVIENATELIAKMLFDRDWETGRLKTHKYWSGKNCPRPYVLA
ncbi:N-acetylmuramoyl-L-alanine amidase XlyA [Peptoclostridium acidaminophilum DSM 3953]|uniref:N-acetylmuramoyl-L-alanine amidase n=1 Tax=Peptoclostridium acidaminophilum DSM 3953 TaxID=1286171 RepID=W8T6A9_PEPAC|nr:N-acetylmuramoyl-L-alanine amidase [Peptoclostridium acidaminophilum]AHM56425.1 N-acetylmuramoyl-L-alanine amidase XlyA [Peptoclostridium acidaminophilum DSM 3953]